MSQNTSWSGERHSFPPHIRQRILERDNHTCRNCRAPATIADHIIPIAEGGRDDESNGQALCRPCSDEKTQREIARGRARRSRRRPTEPHPGLKV